MWKNAAGEAGLDLVRCPSALVMAGGTPGQKRAAAKQKAAGKKIAAKLRL
jgi:hypothetical protein